MNFNHQQTQSSPYPHPVKSIFNAPTPFVKTLKYFILLSVMLFAFMQLTRIIQSLWPPYGFRKDFVQEYLMGKAVIGGLNPYLSCQEIAGRLQVTVGHPIHPHPTPHPPPVVLFAIPLGFLTYPQATVLWFLVEISCMILAAYLLLGWLDVRRDVIRVACLTLIMLAWSPFQDELFYGQLMNLLLVLFMGAFVALRRGMDVVGGICLGCAVAIKLIAWPFVLFLGLKKKWRAALSAVVIVGLANLAAAWFIGIEDVTYYYIKVGPSVSTLHQAQEGNISLWTVGWRLFQGTGSPVLAGLEAPPLVYVPGLAQWVSFFLPLAALIIGLWLAVRMRGFDLPFGILVCLSILVSPVAWNTYLTLLIIPLVIAARCLYALDWPRLETNIFLALSLVLYIPGPTFHRFLLMFAQGPVPEHAVKVPWGIGMLALIPSASLLVLIYVLWRLNHRCPEG